MAPLPGVRRPREDSGKHVRRGHQQKHDLRKRHGGVYAEAENHNAAKRMAVSEVDFLAAPESPGTDHQEAHQQDQHHPHDGNAPVGHRGAAKEMDHRGD